MLRNWQKKLKIYHLIRIIQNEDKVDSIKSYLVNIADKIVELSPDIAESVAS